MHFRDLCIYIYSCLDIDIFYLCVDIYNMFAVKDRRNKQVRELCTVLLCKYV